ncbi:hypothetical protein EYD45_06360 [Hyunsoonleella flava]|uniref:Uncharacterized protein n=1 Tax=Hyunsoonleella flava TaxID=2527939 RepID=A0A4Q9FGB6_9FLAO|nr:hypothetical protein [Hyunsoonleella flava]TBN04880.1 hypothetical protein EYD45_06360 [Hyunsoonleella flava]
MNNDYNNPAFKKLLQKLQEESWQLELLISGFAIFGLFTAFEPISVSGQEAKNAEQVYKLIICIVGLISCGILIFNLLLHVLLRGLWIGALGLRYVSGDIDYEKLNYSNKFTKYLKKRVGSFDKYIATLENYCSIIFAISFLLIFYVLALTFTIIVIALIGNYIIDNDSLPSWVSNGVGIPLMIFFVFGALFTFFDFVTQGLLKKKNWVSKLYFPIYWVFSFVTLSFLYRPIIYNFLDNKFGRRLSFLLTPLFILLFVATSFRYNSSNYFGKNLNSNSYILNNDHYEDLLDEKLENIDNVMIQSKVISDPFVKVFVKYDDNIEDRMFYYNPGLKPKKDIRGVTSDIVIINDFDRKIRKDSLRKEYIKTFNSIYFVAIDSITYKSDFVVSKTKKGTLGFETYVGISSLSEGKHLLDLRRYRVEKDKDTTILRIERIPFWYYKN